MDTSTPEPLVSLGMPEFVKHRGTPLVLSRESDSLAYRIRNTFVEVADEVESENECEDECSGRSRMGSGTGGECRSASSPPVLRTVSSAQLLYKGLPGGSSSPNDESTTGSFSEECVSDGSDALEWSPSGSRAALNSRAKHWAPGQVRQNQPPHEVVRAFAEAVAAGKEAMQSCAFVDKVVPGFGADGWTVTCTCQPDALDAHQIEAAWLCAQEALLKAAAESDGIYIVGYEAAPFQTSQGGLAFHAQLAAAGDVNTACWDFLAKGYCRRNCACWWQHPEWLVPVTFTMAPAKREA